MDQRKHSRFGIASFIISIASAFSMLLLIVVAGLLDASTPSGLDEESIGALIIGLFMFALCGVSLVAFTLGLIGLIQQERKKLFAVLGAAVSVLSVLGMALVVIIGLLLE